METRAKSLVWVKSQARVWEAIFVKVKLFSALSNSSLLFSFTVLKEPNQHLCEKAETA